MFEFSYDSISKVYDDIQKKEQEKFDMTIQAIDAEVTREINSKISSGDFTKTQTDVDGNAYYTFEFYITTLIPSKDNSTIRTPFTNCPTSFPINFSITSEHMTYYRDNICAPKNCFVTFNFSDYKYYIVLYFFATKEDYDSYRVEHLYD